MNVETLPDLFVFELRGAYGTEIELVEALDELADQSAIDSLADQPDEAVYDAVREVLTDYRDGTEARISRLEGVFEATGEQPETRESLVLRGLVAEKERFNNVVLSDDLRHPFYLDFAMKVAEVEIRAYESLVQLARVLDLPEDAVGPLEANLHETMDAADRFARLADGAVEESLADLAENTARGRRLGR